MARKGKKKTTEDSSPVLKKSKSFKRIRGFLTGESRRERKARKASEREANNAAASTDGADDASTVFGVDVDERSVATGAVANSTADSFLKGATEPGSPENKDDKKAYILKVVLLLMDPETRRFELLQLEFDSLKALVSDVLAQIPLSVTEEALREQSYSGIAGKDGKEMPPAKLLATFCKGNEVLVAIPSGVEPKECTRLARPILSDEKVVDMLATSGIDSKGWKEDAKKKKKKSALKKSIETVSEEAGADTKGSSNKVFTIAFVVLVAILLQVFHVYISAPIKLGSTISPGIWLSKCGLLTVLPNCENAYLHMGKDGVVTHYNASKEITWKIEGSVCDAEDSDCVPGMQVQEDRKVIIGGKAVSSVTTYGKLPGDFLTPWPFVDAPKLKVSRK